MTNIISVNIENVNDKLYATSRDIAEKLGKRHEKICAKIKEILTLPEIVEREFVTEQGNKYAEYLLDKDAFTLLLFNFTGFNDFKRAYIKRFNEMEQTLKTQTLTDTENTTPTNNLANNKPKHLTLTPDPDGFSSLSICFSKLRYIVEDDMPLFYLNDIDRLLEVTRLNHIDQERTENNYTIHHILYDYNMTPRSKRINNHEHLFLTLLQLAEFCNRYKTKRSLMLLETLERQSAEYGGSEIEQTRKKLLTITA